MNQETQLVAYLRHSGDSWVLVIVNMDVYNQAGPAIVYLPQEFGGIYQLKDELNGSTYLRHGRELTVVVKPGDGHLFRIKFY